MNRDMGALVRAVVKDMQWNRSVEKIAKRQDVSVEVVEQILQIYTTHPGITTDGILNRDLYDASRDHYRWDTEPAAGLADEGGVRWRAGVLDIFLKMSVIKVVNYPKISDSSKRGKQECGGEG